MERQNQQSFKEKVQRILPELYNEQSLESFNITAETFAFLEDSLEANGYTKFTNPAAAYSELGSQKFVVRREDPRKVLQLLNNGRYEIDFEGDRYSNCVEWSPVTDGPRGIANAYLEGMTNLNNVVTIIGFEPNSEDDIQQLPDATVNFHGLQREKVRSFKGVVDPEAVKFISLRAPGHLLAESKLTEDELFRIDEYLQKKGLGETVDPVMIHRTYLKEAPENYLH